MENTILSLSDMSVKNRIRTLYFDGKEIKEILAIMEIPKGTWDAYYYNNTYALRDFMQECKKELILKESEAVSQKIRSLNTFDEETGKEDSKLLAIQQKEVEFLRETLGKDLGYSKRVETIGLNINKSEPLDEDQKKKLDKLFKNVTGDSIKDSEVIDIEVNTTAI